MRPTQPRIAVIGDIGLDVVAAPEAPPAADTDTAARISLTGGGAGANVAAWLARAGARPTLIGRVGADHAGRSQLEELRARGVLLQVASDHRLPTGTVVVLAAPDGSRTMLTDRGANLDLVAEDLPTDLERGADHLHVSGYTLLHPRPRAAGLAALRRAIAAPLTTSVDASSVAPLSAMGADAFLACTEGVDVCRANAAEAAVLVPRATGARSAAEALAQRYAVAVVSDGPAGAWVAEAGRCVHRPAEATEVVDTVGAGDALTAGFLAAWVAGATPVSALAEGTARASEAVGTAGARPPRP